MKANVGGLDSFIRIFLGVWITYLALHGDIGMWGLLAIALLVSGLSRMSLLYKLFGISTYHEEEHETAAH